MALRCCCCEELEEANGVSLGAEGRSLATGVQQLTGSEGLLNLKVLPRMAAVLVRKIC